ncbi:MAG: tetratricopeptide repeat protein [Planctomycetes bacterium]|nr:tetratricopeptide repeat protein [Planctomycetota bacterium]
MAARAPADRPPGAWRGSIDRLALGVALVAVLVFARTLSHEFLVWDDDQHVTGNARLDPPTLTSVASFWTAPFLGLYVPVSYTLFALEAWVTGGPDPRVFHAVSVLLHALNAALVVRLLARLGARPTGAALGGLLFALHPLQVESVAWISEQRGLLAAAFGLGALSAYAGAERSARRDVAAALLLVLALFSKPSAAVVPALALLLELFLLRRGARWAGPRLCAGLLAAAACLAVTKGLQGDVLVKEAVGFPERLLVAADALEFYARKLVAPCALAADHGRRPSVVLAGGFDASLAVAGLVAGAVLALPALRRAALVPALVFAAGLAPVLGLAPFAHQDISTVADRYAYLALLGPALLVARAWPADAARAAQVLALIVVALLAGASYAQARHWRDTEAVFARVLEVNPRSWIAHTNRGLVRQSRGDLPGAAAEYEAALAAKPDHARALNNLGILRVQMGRAAEGEALLVRAIEADPRYARPHMNLAAVYGNQGRLAAAEACARRAVELSPLDPSLHATLGNVLLRRGSRAAAQSAFERALALRPNDVEARLGLGLVAEAEGDQRSALAHVERALELARTRAPGRVRHLESELARLRAR